MFEQTLNKNDTTVFFLSILKNRLSDQVKRGSIVKALAFGSSTTIHLESLTKILEASLDLIFIKTDVANKPEQNTVIAAQIIEEVFKDVNRHATTPLPRGNFLQRAVSYDLNTNLAWTLPVDQDVQGNYRDSLFN